MKNLQRRLRKLETVFTDAAGLVPPTPKWLEYWDRQFFLYLSGQDDKAIWHCGVEAFRALMHYCDNPNSLAGKLIAENEAAEVSN
jgi:hypothetical protein